MSEAKQSQSRIFFEKKDEAFINKRNLKTQISSRMSRFIRDGAIQLLPKFAIGYSRLKNSLNGYF